MQRDRGHHITAAHCEGTSTLGLTSPLRMVVQAEHLKGLFFSKTLSLSVTETVFCLSKIHPELQPRRTGWRGNRIYHLIPWGNTCWDATPPGMIMLGCGQGRSSFSKGTFLETCLLATSSSNNTTFGDLCRNTKGFLSLLSSKPPTETNYQPQC